MSRLEVNYVDSGTHDGLAFEIEAHTPDGRRFVLAANHLIENEGQADRFVSRVLEAGSIDLEHWFEGYPVYGSPAFVSQEAAASHWAGRVRDGHCDLDSVPDCYRSLL